MSLLKNILARTRFWPEIPAFFYLFALMLYGPISEQYVYQYYSDQVGYNYTINGKSSENCPTGLEKNSTKLMLQKKVQDLVAQFIGKQAFVQNIPSMFMCLIYGPLTDAFGRKPIIVLCILCGLLSCLITSISIILQTNVNILYIANLVLGLGGFFQSNIMAMMAYLCDLNEGKDRAMRIAVIDLVLMICTTLSSFTGGIFLQTFGFKASCLFMLILYTTSFLLATLVLKESLQKENRISISSYCMMPINVIICVFKSRPKKFNLLMLCGIVTLSLFTLPSSLLPIILLYLLNVPLCWNPDAIGYYRGTYLLLLGIGGAIGTKLLPKVMNLPLIMIVSLLSTSAYYIGICFSQTATSLYLSILVGIFAMVNSAVIKGEMSQLVTKKEQGSLFAFLSSLQALVMFISTTIYQKLYRELNARNQPGYTFMFGAVINILPLIIIIIYWIKIRSSLSLEHDDSKYEEFVNEDNERKVKEHEGKYASIIS